MTKHGHRSIKRNNEFNRMLRDEEQGFVQHQKNIKRDVRREEQRESYRHEKNHHQ